MPSNGDLKYLKLLAREYPNIQSASTEIINLQAIMELPKGTEHFMSDIHGEAEAFDHILNNASGMVRQKVEDLFSNSMTEAERQELCTLIYYPRVKLAAERERCERSGAAIEEFYRLTLYRLIEICRLVSSKYTRSKVRKALPRDFEYIIDELLHTNFELKNKETYYRRIIASIIEIDRAEAFICALCELIKRLIVDRLHIVGDIYDRGPGPHEIMDRLISHHNVDIQWGNHDILWMGAAAGSDACIMNVLYNSMKYDNLDIIEDAYGINLRPLAVFASETYLSGGCIHPKTVKPDTSPVAADLLCRMMKAVCVLMWKCEGRIINAHPSYGMEGRNLLHLIDYENKCITIDGATYELKDVDLPTVDRADPYALTPKEAEVVDHLVMSFKNSEKLARHIRFMYAKGSMYLCCNGNLLLHGCIPMEEDGSFSRLTVDGQQYSGKALLDFADRLVRQAYNAPEGSPEREDGLDFMWWLWCGPVSPIFGKEKMTTFERCLIADKAAWKEPKNAYYRFAEEPEVIERILAIFSLTSPYSHIINGHVPVKVKKGEGPVKAGGRLIVIDGGFSKAYQSTTGIAGYTMFFNSYGIRLASHAPFEGIEHAIGENSDIISTSVVFENAKQRITVADTDIGAELQSQIDDLKRLLTAYKSGELKERH